VQGRAGEGVEDPPAVAAAVIEDRSAMRAMDPEPIAAASRAGQALGVEDHDEAGVAGILVHQAGQREVHRRPLSVSAGAARHSVNGGNKVRLPRRVKPGDFPGCEIV